MAMKVRHQPESYLPAGSVRRVEPTIDVKMTLTGPAAATPTADTSQAEAAARASKPPAKRVLSYQLSSQMPSGVILTSLLTTVVALRNGATRATDVTAEQWVAYQRKLQGTVQPWDDTAVGDRWRTAHMHHFERSAPWTGIGPEPSEELHIGCSAYLPEAFTADPDEHPAATERPDVWRAYAQLRMPRTPLEVMHLYVTTLKVDDLIAGLAVACTTVLPPELWQTSKQEQLDADFLHLATATVDTARPWLMTPGHFGTFA